MANLLIKYKRTLLGFVLKFTVLLLSVGVAVFFGVRKIELEHFDKVIYQKWSAYGYVPEEKTYNLLGAGKLPFLVEHRLKDLRTLWKHVAENTDYPEKYNSKVFKVAFIGDSYVYGIGVLETERITTLLEQRMNIVRPTKVYSFAQLADDGLEYYANFEAAERYLKPDLYIVGMVWNDFESPSDKYPGEDQIHERLRKICTQPEFWEQFSPESSSWETIIGRHTQITLSESYANYCYMQEFVKDIQTNRKVMFFNFNSFGGHDWCATYDDINHVNQSFVMKEYEKLVHQADGVIFGLNVEDWGNWKPVSQTEAHPGKLMHQEGAQILFNELLREPKWGFVQKGVHLYKWETIWTKIDKWSAN